MGEPPVTCGYFCNVLLLCNNNNDNNNDNCTCYAEYNPHISLLESHFIAHYLDLRMSLSLINHDSPKGVLILDFLPLIFFHPFPSNNPSLTFSIVSLFLFSLSSGVKTELKVDETGKVQSRTKFWEDIIRASPFLIEPKSAIIPPYSSQIFHVTLSRTDVLGKLRATFTGSILIDDNIKAETKKVTHNRQQGGDDVMMKLLQYALFPVVFHCFF